MDINELNPGGKDIFTHLFPAMLEEYNFRTVPKDGSDFREGMKFNNGEFVKRDGTVLPINCIIFTDGIAAETYSSTHDSEAFLEEALSRLPSLGFAFSSDMVRRKAYASQVVVKCPKPLNALNPKLSDFANHISSAVGESPFEPAVVEFWPDQRLAYKPVNFSFQKKAGEPPSSDRYWSQAPLHTDKHLELLEEFEGILSQ